MKLALCTLTNFGSYEKLEFDFSNQGLALISGPTGSGKSTIMDGPCWVLSGHTSKNGSVDEVRSWSAPNNPTTGTLAVETNAGPITVTRIRGTQSENDLFWYDKNLVKVRGKDLKDTQKLLNQCLGLDLDLYLSASYFCEFSPTTNFFLNTSKQKRELFEKIADLDFAKNLAEKTTEALKKTRKSYQEKESAITRLSGYLDARKTALLDVSVRAENYQAESTARIGLLRRQADNFEEDKQNKIKEIEDNINYHGESIVRLEKEFLTYTQECPTCGNSSAEWYDCREMIRRNKSTVESYNREISEIKTSINKYLEQINQEQVRENVYLSQKDTIICDIKNKEKELEDLNAGMLDLKARMSGLEQLYDLSFVMRGQLLQKAVQSIADHTNELIEKYFGGVFGVEFAIEDADKLEVSIFNNGHSCVFRQLSKGQRQILKLCFSVAIMEASSNKAGVHFSVLMMDEALDGLDVSSKVKAFSLFDYLSTKHESVLIIDHSEELKSMFSKVYTVSMSEDRSRIEEII